MEVFIIGQYDLFRKISKSSLTPKQRTLTQIQTDILSDFEDTPSYQTVTINNSTTPQDVQIVTVTNQSTKENHKKMLSKPLETFDVGDIVVWGSLTYLVTDIDEDEQIQTKGKIQLCNNTLNLYKNGILSQVPCIILDKTNMNLESNKYISTIDCDIAVLVTNDIRNYLISPNDIFKISRWNYKVLKPDDITKPGLIVLPMKFIESEEESHVFAVNILNPTYYTYAYLNRGMIMDVNDGLAVNVKSGDTLQLEVEVTDNNVGILPTPVISYSSSDVTVATVSSTGLVTMVSAGSCVISAECNEASDTIKVCVVESDMDNYSYTILSTTTPDTEIKLNQTKVFTAVKYNNGVAMTQAFTFSASGDATAYTLTTVDGNTCTVKCLKSGYSIVLKATDNSDSSGTVSKTIVLKSLF